MLEKFLFKLERTVAQYLSKYNENDVKELFNDTIYVYLLIWYCCISEGVDDDILWNIFFYITIISTLSIFVIMFRNCRLILMINYCIMCMLSITSYMIYDDPYYISDWLILTH